MQFLRQLRFRHADSCELLVQAIIRIHFIVTPFSFTLLYKIIEKSKGCGTEIAVTFTFWIGIFHDKPEF